MPIVHIDYDEWYPVYSVESDGQEVELSDADIERVKKAFEEFHAVQHILAKAYNG